MAIVIELDNTYQTDTISLTSGVVQYISGTLQDQVNPSYDDKEISFQTIAKGTGPEIREAIRDIERLLNKIAIFMEHKTYDESIWLQIKSEGGEAKRRTLLKAWSRVDENTGTSDSLLDKSFMLISTWTFTRHHCWEVEPAGAESVTVVASSMNSGGAMAGTVTTQAVGHDGFEWENNPFAEWGTKGARISSADFRFLDPSMDESWDRIWVGLKRVRSTESSSARWRAHTNFQDAYGMTKIDTNVDGAQTAANGLNGLVCAVNFAASPGTAWAPRVYNDIPTGHKYSAPGVYLVLFRMKVGADTVARVGMFHAWDNLTTQGGVADHYDDVYVESNEWHMYEMGVIQVPQGGYRRLQRDSILAGEGGLHENVIGFSAERISGTGSLYVDYLTWIPQEYSFSGSNINTHDLDFLITVVDEEDNLHGTSTRWNPFHVYAADLAAKNWEFPLAIGEEFIMVVVGDTFFGDIEHQFDIKVDSAMGVLPRFHSYNAE